MLSKTEITKPNVYIATDLEGLVAEHSALDVAEAVDKSPFVKNIFAVEGIYDLFSLSHATESMLKRVAEICSDELSLADIVVADLRNGDPVEIGYALGKGIPLILFNPEKKQVSPLVYGKELFEATTLTELEDYNYLNVTIN